MPPIIVLQESRKSRKLSECLVVVLFAAPLSGPWKPIAVTSDHSPSWHRRDDLRNGDIRDTQNSPF